MRRLFALNASVAIVALLAACGGSSGGDPGGGSPVGDSGGGTWHINNQQTRNQDVYFSDEEVAAGLAFMEETIVIPGGERNSRDSSQAKCWMVINNSGMLKQFMWCGPLVNADGLDEWSRYPFGTEGSEDERVITHAPTLRDRVGMLADSDTLARPDGLPVPESGKPGAERQAVASPTSKVCGITGTITYQDVTLDLAQADYMEITSTVEENELTGAGSVTSFIVTHTIRFWDDAADAGHVLTLSSIGPTDGPFEPRNLSLNPYLQTRDQMESGMGASQSLTGSPEDGSTFDVRGADGARVVTTASRETFAGDETAEIDITLTCE